MLVRTALVTLLLTTSASAVVTGRLAIPSAEGWGRNALSGWPTTPTVCRVTNTNSSGAGSLASCVEGVNNQIVVFAVAGTISLADCLAIDGHHIAVFGQTAPDDGIQIMRDATLDDTCRNTLSITGDHVVLQHLRVRHAVNVTDPLGVDCFNGAAIDISDGSTDVLLDHVSTAWGTDDGVHVGANLVTNGPYRVTIQNSLLGEPLAADDPNDADTCDTTGKAAFDIGEKTSYIGNLIAMYQRRGIWFSGGDYHEVINNLFYRIGTDEIPGIIYDCSGSDNKSTKMTFSGNVWTEKTGDTSEPPINTYKHTNCPGEGCDGISVYAAGNKDSTVTNEMGSQDGLFRCRTFAANGCTVTVGGEGACASHTLYKSADPHKSLRAEAAVFADDLETTLISSVGAQPRDSVDTCIAGHAAARDGSINTETLGVAVTQVTDGCGPADTLTGSACTDSDTDGLCDSWETMYFGSTVAKATEDFDEDGYFNIEEFAHGMNPYDGAPPIYVAIWGQSNNVYPGEDLGERETTSPHGARKLRSMTYHSGHRRPLDDIEGPTYPSQPADRVSAWPAMAGRVMDVAKRPLHIAPASVGNTSLVLPIPEWAPPAGARYVAGLAAARTLPRIDAVLWDQGQSDGGEDVPKATYKAAFKDLADAVWTELGVPIIVSPINNNDWCGEPDQGLDDIRQAQIEAAAEHDHIELGPEQNDLETLCSPNALHIQDVSTHGRRWADAVLAVVP